MTARVRAFLIPLFTLAMSVTIGLSATGCSGSCAEAKDLCESCEVPEFGNCDRFDELSSEQCEAEVEGYEANCPDA